ncbi:retropepsin-like aspartic protease [Deltaproteobacteria bacterium TL4]
MGKIIQKALLKNTGDLNIKQEQPAMDIRVRELDVEFMVDTGAAMVCLPVNLIEKLGLYPIQEREVMTANGTVIRRIYSPVRLNIMDREMDMNVMELPLGTPPLLGYLPMEALDLYPNLQKQILEGNPKYNGKMIIDLL